MSSQHAARKALLPFAGSFAGLFAVWLVLTALLQGASGYDDSCRTSPTSAIFPPQEGWVYAYEKQDLDGAGLCQRFRGDVSGRSYRNDLQELQKVGDNQISSFWVGPNTRLEACAKEDRGAPCLSWGPFAIATRIATIGRLDNQASEIWVYGHPSVRVSGMRRSSP